MTPKISERPLPTRNSSAPYEMPLKAWVSQNCVFIPSPTPLNRESPTSYLTTASADRKRRGEMNHTAYLASAAAFAGWGWRELRRLARFCAADFLGGMIGSRR